jgi:hypothetical protein
VSMIQQLASDGPLFPNPVKEGLPTNRPLDGIGSFVKPDGRFASGWTMVHDMLGHVFDKLRVRGRLPAMAF